MSKDKNDKPATPAQAPEGQNLAQAGIQVVTQYVKDMSFESPNSPESLVAGWPQPETGVHISVGQRLVRENAYECLLHLRVEAKNKADGRTAFIIDLHYGALVVLHGIPAESHQPVLMVEVPKLLFPFAREIVASAAAHGGYPPLYLTPVSFESIYMQEMRRLQAEKAKQAG
jgi:preprotein translocase subunit SecB